MQTACVDGPMHVGGDQHSKELYTCQGADVGFSEGGG